MQMDFMKTMMCLSMILVGIAASACQPAPVDADKAVVSAPQMRPDQDAYVGGTTFNAVADIRCFGLADPSQTVCPAGVIRRQDGSAEVVVNSSSGRRILYFNASQRGVRADPPNNPFSFSIDHEGIVTVSVGEEAYNFPVEFLRGD